MDEQKTDANQIFFRCYRYWVDRGLIARNSHAANSVLIAVGCLINPVSMEGFLSYRSIVKASGVSSFSTVKRALDQLEEHGILEIGTGLSHNGNDANYYRFRRPPMARPAKSGKRKVVEIGKNAPVEAINFG